MREEGEGMQEWSEAAYDAAYRLRWQAEALAGVQYPQKGRRPLLSVPADMTASLMMEKAGVTLKLIAAVSYANPDRLRRRLIVAKALMMFAPYAARVEDLMQHMPRFPAAQPPGLAAAKEAPCAAHQAG